MHDVDNEDSKITKGGTTGSQVGERFVTWCINDKESWNFKIKFFSMFHDRDVMLKVIFWEVSSTNLLSDTSCFIGLNVCFSELIKDKRLTRVYMTHDTNDGTTQFLSRLGFTSVLPRLEQGELTGSSRCGIRASTSAIESIACQDFLLSSSALLFIVSFGLRWLFLLLLLLIR